MPYNIYNGRQVAPYAGGQTVPTSGTYFATYGGQNVVPYGGNGGPTPPGALPTGGGLISRGMAAVGAGGPGTEAYRKKQVDQAATDAGNFAGQGETGYGNMTKELAKDRDFYREMMGGKNSIATEQLRQGLQQQLSQQQAMAAGASPANAAMAARNAAMNMGKASYGMTGQAAAAQLAERQMAAEQLARLNLGQREQDINVGVGSRKNQIDALNPGMDKPKGPSTWEKIFAGGAAVAPLFSDERLKEDVKGGDKAVRHALSKLSAKSYRYKDEGHGKGEQLGILAQDLERAGLKQAVIDTPVGKAVDVGKLSGANAAMIAHLGKRISKLEKGRK